MTFHQNQKEFKEAIQAAAEYFGIREVLIEKDYWVSFVLKNLSQSEYKDWVVFKGGTALAKSYTFIARLSEDIDLALISKEKLGDAKRKALFKSIENTLSTSLKPVHHPDTLKKGRNRRTFYEYPKITDSTDYGVLKDLIQVEINSFTNPVPHTECEVNCLLYKFLSKKGFSKDIQKYGLNPVQLNVLSLERSFAEKLLSCIRLSYEGIDRLKKKIRHFYDLHMILSNHDILNDKTKDIIALARHDDEKNPLFAGEWLNNKLIDSPLFQKTDNIWKELIPVYQEEMPQLCWLDEIPSQEAIMNSMNQIKDFVRDFENL